MSDQDNQLERVTRPAPARANAGTARHRAHDVARSFRRRRLVLVLVVALVAFVIASLVSSNPAPHAPRAGSSGPSAVATSQGIAAIEAGVLPWQLAAPISREVVLRGPRVNELIIAGGLSGSGTSDSGIYAMDTAKGQLTSLGSLATATHDAAGVLLGNHGLVFGGGNAKPSAAAQGFVTDGTALASGSLPKERADATAVTIGATAYVVGGYDGPSMDAEVLSTTDGLHFKNVATLPVPVRYPAVAVLGMRIYVFGGQESNGRVVRTVQVVDPSTHSAARLGELPVALSGATAANLGGTVYLAGGETASGTSALRPVADVLAFDPVRIAFLHAGSLTEPVANAGAAVLGKRLWILGGETAGGALSATVQMLEPNRGFGRAGSTGAGSPFFGGQLLIADRGNNRLLLLDDTDKVIWTYPSLHRPAPRGGFYFPDDAFFVRHGTAIISNQEDNETIVVIAYPSGRILWSYGHPRSPGSAPGYLNSPDDAYLLRNGDITVADPMNCRVLILTARKKVRTQIGTTGSCQHLAPGQLGSPNGDTPLSNGDLLISEINGSWVDEYTTTRRLVWSVHLPIGYPSDPQQIGPDTYLVANYENPGGIVEFNRAGRILYRYQPTSGSGVLNRPSLVELFPSGVFMLNDDYNNRMVAIDPATGALIWQYGVNGQAGTAPGLLYIPDGFDLLGPGGSTPTHTATG